MYTKVTIGTCASLVEEYCDHHHCWISSNGVKKAAGLLVRYLTKNEFLEAHSQDEIESATYAAVFDAAVSEGVAAY